MALVISMVSLGVRIFFPHFHSSKLLVEGARSSNICRELYHLYCALKDYFTKEAWQQDTFFDTFYG